VKETLERQKQIDEETSEREAAAVAEAQRLKEEAEGIKKRAQEASPPCSNPSTLNLNTE